MDTGRRWRVSHGTNRRENITDWALEEFRLRYHDPSITKWDIFHYLYAVLHHPEYRQRYAANLRRELPRIPFVSAKPDHVGADALVCPAGQSPAALEPAALKGDGFSHPAATTSSSSCHSQAASAIPLRLSPSGCHSEAASAVEESAVPSASKKQIPHGMNRARNDKKDDDPTVEERGFSPASDGPEAERASAPVATDLDTFRAFVLAGQRLAEIHIHYEQQPEYPLTKTEKAGERLDWRVTKMRLSKDKSSLIYNQFLTLAGIPPETYDYRLGNRSALEWVIDDRQAQRHHQRSQPPRRSAIHRSSGCPGDHRQPGNSEDMASAPSARFV